MTAREYGGLDLSSTPSVGTDHLTWDSVIGKNGIGRCNSNGLLLLQYCAEHGLLITNTTFRLPARSRTSWMHPRSGHWRLIDFVIVRNRQDVRVTKSTCGADCWTDHGLIISKMKIRILPKRRPQGKPAIKCLNSFQLKKHSVCEELVDSLDEKCKHIEITDNIEETWSRFRDTVYGAASETLSFNKRKHQDWFDENKEEITRMLEEKNRLYRAYLNDKSPSRKAALDNTRNTVQRKLREMQNTWLSQKADEIQSYSGRNDTKWFYGAVKAVYGPQPASSSPLFSADGKTFLTQKSQILERWAEHFESVLSRPSHINEDAIKSLPQVDNNHALDTSPHPARSRESHRPAVKRQAPGADGISAGVYKHGGP
ncbi:craniofacial development protein 2 [Elysia marginata]|uniref:Craniofacial development protein 2 n=1 Tax=Elysia marginata TaxID=1093978 RepID=A0AAV4JDY1_9GAST|nr:craniofacial development protein 2 [Elysia marginata]